MANLQKYTKAQIGGITRHFERYKKENGEYIQFGNQEINTEKTELNYNLAPGNNQLKFIKKRTEELKVFNRSDVNVMASWVVTLPKEIEENSEEEKLFFEETYHFLKEKYGEKNIISAHVHKDETTPHMHFAFVPVVFDKSKNKEKVSAKILLDRNHLKKFHGELDQHMEKVFGRDIGILNEATKEGNQKISALKRTTRLNKIKEIEKHIEALEKKENALKMKIEGLQHEYEGKVLTQKGLDAIQPEKTITGAVKNISIEDIQNLKKTASIHTKTKIENEKLKSELKGLKDNYKKLSAEYSLLKNQIPTINENLEKLKMENRLNQLEKAFEKLPEDMKKELLKNNKRQSKQQEYER